MPISSTQISQMNAMYQQQMAMQFQNASNIGAGVPFSESIVGGGMNRAAAVGGPMASLGLGLMGLDPISLGLRAGMGASGMGMGFAGAGAVGLGAAGLAGAGMMAVGYGANQVFTGAQQQQAFNSSMNSTFRFANNMGGHGFGRQGLGDIGAMMRQMSTEQGPAGQMVGFEELGRLANNMGRMGMAQGIRDAKDFSEKFREMIKTVKTVAEEMGTSLEEAQKLMGAMRGAGVFGMGRASAFASKVRLGAAAGGMATSELTGMMQVGSQISRMVGGRGRAGAAGGIETLTNIGVAQQMGLISEEDIYNTTGLTGAEGRRAMATRQMEMSAQFLKGGLGRRFLASVAGKNGSLDAASVEEYMAGGVGTDRTTQMYQRNLAKVGRADFIRNEGRLRGAALEQFGGLAPMIAMKGWLDQRGINANEDNDRAMIFMQRQLGMGSDESEMMLRQVRELPNLLRQRRVAGQDDDFQRKMAERRSHQGLEGIKHKFEKAREDVNSVLQQVGASFYEQMSDAVDGFINRVTDTYVKETRNDVAGAFRSMMSGGAMGAEAAGTTFGIGGKSFSSAAGRSSNLLKGGPSDMSIFNSTDAESFSKAGFGFKGGSLTEHMAKVSQITGVFKGGSGGLEDGTEVAMAGASAAGAFRQAMMGDMSSTKGMDRLQSFGTFLRGQAGLGGLADRYAAADDVEKAKILATFSGKGGADVDQSGAFADPGMRGVYAQSGMRTLGEGADAVGAAFGNKGRGSMFGGASTKDSRVGAFLLSEGGRDLITKVMSDSASIRASARTSVEKQVIALKGKDGRTDAEEAQLQGLSGMLMSQKLTEMEVNGASKEQLDAEAERMGKENGISATEVRSRVATIGALSERNKKMATDEAGLRFGEEARGSLAGLQRGGLVTGSGTNLTLNAAATKNLGGGASGQAFLNAMLQTQKTMAQMGPGADNQALLGQAQHSIKDMSLAMGNMSVAEMRALAGGLVGIEGTEDARSELGRSASIGEHILGGKKRGKGGALSSAADVLGVNLSPKQIQDMLASGGVEGVSKAIAGELGMGGNEAFMKQLTGALGDIQGGREGTGAVGLKGLMDNESVQKARGLQKEQREAGDPTAQLKNIADSAKNMEKYMQDSYTALNEMNLRGRGDPEAVK